MKIVVNQEAVASADLAPVKPAAEWHPNRQYFDLPPGLEHYKLLANISSQLPGGHVVDIGTYLGYSALALAAGNPKCTVFTFDVVPPQWPDDVKLPETIQALVGDITSPEFTECLLKTRLIFLDVDPHDGKQERAIFAHLVDIGYKGLLLCDDIHLNQAMETFWAELPNTLKKVDLTSVGHVTGTGAVVFDPNTIDLVRP